jgi:AcrR family transcriptional regulator
MECSTIIWKSGKDDLILTDRSVNITMAPRTTAQFEAIREKRREKIILAAMELFSRQTYHNTSVADISKQAGVSKGLIYNYFTTKEDILNGILDYLFAIGDQMVAETRAAGTPKEELRHLIGQVFRFLHQQALISRMLIPLALEMGKFDFINEVIDRKMRDYLGLLVQIFSDMDYPDPEMEAWTLGVLFDGISLDYNVLGDRMPLDRMEQYLYKKYNL